MSTLKINTLQIGQSGTATNNFCWSQPSTPDGTVRLGNGNAGSATDILIATSSGNLGLGVTPSAWSTGKAIEVGSLGSALWGTGANNTKITSNCYFNGSYKYAATGYANRIDVGGGGGTIEFFTAPSGTAGNTISFTQALTLTAAANLLLGGTADPGGSNALYIANRGSVPGTPSGGGVIYVESGALKYKGSSGTVTTLANA